MKVILVGARGQLGCALQSSSLASNFEVFPLDRSQLDITCENQVYEVLEGLAPDVIINAAAYTAVDKAESDEAQAYLVNKQGPAILGMAANRLGAKVVHVSTDFVFDGLKATPYAPSDVTVPLSVYGKSKLAGEQALQDIKGLESTIIRTSWLYSHTHPCFVATMLKLMRTKPSLGVIADQVGSPTSVRSLAEVIWRIIGAKQFGGIYHWSDAGVASWYDFAQSIQSLAFELGLLEQVIEIKPLTTQQYPTPAVRPPYSVMDKSDLYQLLDIEVPIHWQHELKLSLKQMLYTSEKNGIEKSNA